MAKAYHFELKGVATLVVIMFFLVLLSFAFGFLIGVKTCKPSPSKTEIEQSASDVATKANEAKKANEADKADK